MNRRWTGEAGVLLRLISISLLVIFFSYLVQAQKSRPPYQWDWRHAQRWPLKPNLKTANLDPKQRKAIFEVSRRAFVDDKDWTENEPESIWDDTIWSERVRLIDLDGDRVPEVLLWGAGPESSGDGNSTFRILKKSGATYKILYDGFAEALNIDHRGDPSHPTIVLYGHDSVSEGSIELYQIGKDGVFHLLAAYKVNWPDAQFRGREPVLTPTKDIGLHHDH
jgi:hypothetical protein